MSFIAGIAAFVIGLIALLVCLLLVGRKVLAGSKKKGVVIKDGISFAESKIIYEEIALVMEEAEIDPDALLKLMKNILAKKKMQRAQQEVSESQMLATELRQAADEAVVKGV